MSDALDMPETDDLLHFALLFSVASRPDGEGVVWDQETTDDAFQAACIALDIDNDDIQIIQSRNSGVCQAGMVLFDLDTAAARYAGDPMEEPLALIADGAIKLIEAHIVGAGEVDCDTISKAFAPVKEGLSHMPDGK